MLLHMPSRGSVAVSTLLGLLTTVLDSSVSGLINWQGERLDFFSGNSNMTFTIPAVLSSFDPRPTDDACEVSVHANVCHQEDHLSSCRKKTLAFEAISDLHAQLDGDSSGGVDFSEAEKISRFLWQHNYQPCFYFDLAHNWTVQETIRWLGEGVELPQYDQVFLLHNVDGETLPRLVMRNQTYLNDHLGVKNQFHRRKLVLKTMDLILFGPPKKLSASYKELSVITACAFGIFLLSFFCINYHYTRKMRGRDAQAADGLYAAEQTLRELQQNSPFRNSNSQNTGDMRFPPAAQLNSVGLLFAFCYNAFQLPVFDTPILIHNPTHFDVITDCVTTCDAGSEK
ncbi:unnamed protein product [Schistocephalus solidus]|uniref:SAM domain-containing protein n=1 Tax=Schistocephalus solidus TaxID=70667 RepID=A0A183T0K6_SCHSO|nr:unnamed protein product [Schistocephalus solidus]